MLGALLLAGVPTREPASKTQCPTAPVQVAVYKDCCGHWVARAPRPGDPFFVQCHCAEKRAADRQAAPESHQDLYFAPAEELRGREILTRTRLAFDYQRSRLDAPARPSGHPPPVV